MARAGTQAPAKKAALIRREGNLRRVCLGISAISTFLFASCPENPANAMTLGAPSAMHAAIVDIAVLIGPTAVLDGYTIDIGPTMDVPKGTSVPRITIITGAVGHQARHTATVHPTTTYPNRGAQWEATVAGTNNPLSHSPNL